MSVFLEEMRNSKFSQVECCVEQPVCVPVNAAVSLFTITGGPVYGMFVGVVSTVLGGNTNGTLAITTTTPAATVALSTTVAINSQAAGSSIRFVGAGGVLTPDTAGSKIVDPVTVADCWYLLTIGTVIFTMTASRTGNIKWYLRYRPLSSNSLVVAA